LAFWRVSIETRGWALDGGRGAAGVCAEARLNRVWLSKAANISTPALVNRAKVARDFMVSPVPKLAASASNTQPEFIMIERTRW
jgi:hypothetical protein